MNVTSKTIGNEASRKNFNSIFLIVFKNIETVAAVNNPKYIPAHLAQTKVSKPPAVISLVFS